MWVANSGSSPEDRDHFLGLHLRAMGPDAGHSGGQTVPFELCRLGYSLCSDGGAFGP